MDYSQGLFFKSIEERRKAEEILALKGINVVNETSYTAILKEEASNQLEVAMEDVFEDTPMENVKDNEELFNKIKEFITESDYEYDGNILNDFEDKIREDVGGRLKEIKQILLNEPNIFENIKEAVFESTEKNTDGIYDVFVICDSEKILADESFLSVQIKSGDILKGVIVDDGEKKIFKIVEIVNYEAIHGAFSSLKK